jgi:hypothetical protein
MITSDIDPSVLRPGISNYAYRPSTAEVIAAAARCGVSYPSTRTVARLNIPQYEFPGDRRYQNYLGGE